VERSIEARSGKHCCSEKVMGVTYSGRVFVALGIQHELRIRLTVIHSLHGCTIYSSSVHKQHFFEKENVEQNSVF